LACPLRPDRWPDPPRRCLPPAWWQSEGSRRSCGLPPAVLRPSMARSRRASPSPHCCISLRSPATREPRGELPLTPRPVLGDGWAAARHRCHDHKRRGRDRMGSGKIRPARAHESGTDARGQSLSPVANRTAAKGAAGVRRGPAHVNGSGTSSPRRRARNASVSDDATAQRVPGLRAPPSAMFKTTRRDQRGSAATSPITMIAGG
jgi:hypothetical protein